MLSKTVSENIDLTLDYRSINLKGSPVSVNSVVMNNGIFPRYIEFASNTITSVANTAVGATSWTTAASGNYNTYSSGTPSLSPTAYFTASGNTITVLKSGYYHVHTLAKTNASIASGAFWNLNVAFTDGTESGEGPSSDRYGQAANLPVIETMSCEYCRYMIAGSILQPAWTSSTAGISVIIEVKITQLA